MTGSVVAFRAIMLMPVILLAPAILVVPDGHALRGRHSGHALDRNGQGQQGHGKNAEKVSRHRWKLYASLFEGDSRRKFQWCAWTTA